VDRLAVQVALQRAERDCAAIGRPAGEEPAARRMHRVLAPRPDIDDEDPFGADSAWVAQVAAPRRAEDDRATVRREAWVEVESAAGARDASPAGAVCVHHPDVAVAGAIGNDASERRPLGGCDRPGPLDGGPRWAAGVAATLSSASAHSERTERYTRPRESPQERRGEVGSLQSRGWVQSFEKS